MPQQLRPPPIDPHSDIRPGMRVLDVQGKALGKIDAVDRDAATDQVVALRVQHGVLRWDRTRVLVQHVTHVQQDAVVLSLSRDRFQRLPRTTKDAAAGSDGR